MKKFIFEAKLEADKAECTGYKLTYSIESTGLEMLYY